MTRIDEGSPRRSRRGAAAVVALAAGGIAMLAGCGEHAVVGVDDAGKPLPSLVRAGHRYAAMVTADDRSGLASMAGPRNVGTRLDQILAAYGGHRLRVTGYEGDDANLASVRFAVLCGAGHEVRFGQGFSYSGSGWHPVFRVFPAEAGVPSVSTPGQRPPAPPGCPSG